MYPLFLVCALPCHRHLAAALCCCYVSCLASLPCSKAVSSSNSAERVRLLPPASCGLHLCRSVFVPYLLQRLDHARFHGVCFHSPATRQWMIQDAQGRCSAKSRSHLQEADCFVVFDDARCRGADLRLRQTALGLLTVATGLQKDKLMQVSV